MNYAIDYVYTSVSSKIKYLRLTAVCLYPFRGVWIVLDNSVFEIFITDEETNIILV